MDLLAYAQIDEYEKLLTSNNIKIPRLRGIDPCEGMKPWTNEECKKSIERIRNRTCEDLCTAIPFWSSKPEYYEFSDWTDCLREYYMIIDKSIGRIGTNGIRWDRIHGWKRRRLKTEIHNNVKKFDRYVATWNRYCGCKDVLRIHSRIGGKNWSYYGGGELVCQPWFIEKVDDYFDSTYCDIYVRVNR